MEMEIVKTDISEILEDTYAGDTIKMQKCLDEDKRIYVFERYSGVSGGLIGYEVVRGVKSKNPDGSIVYTYPSTSQFGKYGYFVAKRFADNPTRGIKYYADKLAAMGKKSVNVLS